MTESKWSVPESQVYRRARELLESNERAVLATVIDVDGNAYRRPGATMLLTPDGDAVGSVTAGCLEDEIRRLVVDVLEAGEPRVETYDLMEDDEDVWGLGVGCNGIIDVLLEPLTATHEPLLDAVEANEPVGTVTVVDGEVPFGRTGWYRPESGFVEVSELPAWLASAVEPEIQARLDGDRSGVVRVETADGEATVFVDAFVPPPKLIVVGSGHDVGPVVELAANVDFRVHVVGYRGLTTASEFPAADRVRSTSPARIGEVETFDEDTYVVVMTHNFVDDRLTLDALLDTRVPYIGLMGPSERFEELLDAMADDATAESPTEADFDRLYTPIGLDLGGGSPYQIAHSIVAELMAVANDRDPKHLSAREGPIHRRVDAE